MADESIRARLVFPDESRTIRLEGFTIDSLTVLVRSSIVNPVWGLPARRIDVTALSGR